MRDERRGSKGASAETELSRLTMAPRTLASLPLTSPASQYRSEHFLASTPRDQEPSTPRNAAWG